MMVEVAVPPPRLLVLDRVGARKLDRDQFTVGTAETVGKYSDRVSFITSRARRKFCNAAASVWLLVTVTWSSSAFNSGCWNNSHQLPLITASCGSACFQSLVFQPSVLAASAGVISLKAAGVSIPGFL